MREILCVSFLGRGCEKDNKMAYQYMRRGCDLNDPRGCLHAGTFAISEEKLERSRDVQISRGMEMLKKACDGNVESGCFYLSGIFLKGIEGFIEKNFKEAYVLSLKSCELGNPYACANLSMMHKKGDGVQKNLDLAKSFKSRADELLKQLKQVQPQLKFQQGIDS